MRYANPEFNSPCGVAGAFADYGVIGGVLFLGLLGAIVGGISNWLNRRRSQPASGTWGDIKALVVLAGMLTIAVVELLDAGALLHPLVERVSLGLTLFYFGSR